MATKKKPQFCVIRMATPGRDLPSLVYTRMKCVSTRAAAEKLRKQYVAQLARRYKIKKMTKPGPVWKHK